ncbi:hypothetical protein [Vibrio harveyi]|uniref:hypothetical protein n=1 Tax=Vibrio harveyi TaxID=669 RepID=UPI00247FAFD4|nr:hypothetical protein [Vibrio harveyi]
MKPQFSITLASIIIPLAFVSNSHAASEEWTLEMNDSCNSFKLELPLPAVDATCDLDDRSGNPSNWFNPFETCSLDFDMIGLPSLGDIAAGVAGAVCDAVKEVKDQTLDKVLDEINSEIPNDLWDEINGEVDLNDKLTGGSKGDNSWTNPDVAQPDVGKDNCYTTDAKGSTIIVPCDIAKPKAKDPNACYVKSGSYGSPFAPIPCNRFSQEREICIARWEQDDVTGQIKPILSPCTSSLRASLSEACTDSKGNTNYCREWTSTPTQHERQCSFERKLGQGDTETYIASCYGVEKACYGHLNGLFQAAQCQQFHDFFFQNPNSQGVFDDFWSHVRHNRKSIDS